MTMRYAHLATNDLDGCVIVLETPRCNGSDAESPPSSAAMQETKSEPVAVKTLSKAAKKSAKS
jgi:hypothetical protein